MQVRLEVNHDKANVKRVVLRQDAVIGRGKECNLRIASNLVSRQHCRIVLGRDRVFVRDLGSSNGTWLAGVRLPREQDVPLPPGAELSIGGVTFVVRYDAPADDVPSGSTVETAAYRAERDARESAAPEVEERGAGGPASGKEAPLPVARPVRPAAASPPPAEMEDEPEPVLELIDVPAEVPFVAADAPDLEIDEALAAPAAAAAAVPDILIDEEMPAAEKRPGLLGRLFGRGRKRAEAAPRSDGPVPEDAAAGDETLPDFPQPESQAEAASAAGVAEGETPPGEFQLPPAGAVAGAAGAEDSLRFLSAADEDAAQSPPPAAADEDLGDFLKQLGKE
ncbi:MAG: FHA domain-containing protein [Planctomycetales bacterium]